MTTKNIYESGTDPQEAERLATFDIPTKISLDAIGSMAVGSTLLDIGAGENPGIRSYALGHDVRYIPYDVRFDPLVSHKTEAALPVQGDARSLPFVDSSIDSAHARFVLAHFNPEDRKQITQEAWRVVKPEGSLTLVDYDWTTIKGSQAMEALRDITLREVKIFDASFGVNSLNEIASILPNANIREKRVSSPLLNDYGPVIGLKSVTMAALEASGADNGIKSQTLSVFEDLLAESQSNQPAGFIMPDMVAIQITKRA